MDDNGSRHADAMNPIKRPYKLGLEREMSIMFTDEPARPTTAWGWTLAAVLWAASLTFGVEASADSTSTPANAAPIFSTDTSVSVSENTTSVATAAAIDKDGDGLTYAISGGADARLFEIAPASGGITFMTAPDFERPADSGGDNIYTFEVSASDGNGGSDTAAFTVSVTNAPDERYIEEVFAETIVSDDIRFATVNGRDLALNVITPMGDSETSRPFVLLATGGAFAFTQRAWSIPIAERFARAGYVAAVMDYRTRGSRPQGAEARIAALEATHDMLAAVRFMRANASTYGIDPNMFVVGGTSAGAFMAISAGTLDPDDPMTDEFTALLETMGGVYGNVGEHLDQSSTVQGVYAISGAIFGLETIDAESAPIYAVHNALDPVAPCGTLTMSQPDLVVSGKLSGSCEFIPAFEGLGVPTGSFIVPDDTGHVAFTNEEWALFTTEALKLYKREIIAVK